MKIMIVEPDEGMGPLMEMILSEHGHDPTLYTDGLEAWIRCQKAPPDMIILDADTAVADGLTLGYALSNDPMTSDIPLIVTSEEWQPELERWAENTYIWSYLPKPFSLNEIVQIVQRRETICR